MKNSILIFIFSIFTTLVYGQSNNTKMSKFGEFQDDWALIEIQGLFGFIDRHGFEVVKPTYEKISQFGEIHEDWARVEIDGMFGFIDKHGFMVVKPKYKMTNDIKPD